MTPSTHPLPPKLMEPIEAYIGLVRIHLVRAGTPGQESDETLAALREQIVEMVNERAEQSPAVADVQAVLAQMEPAEAYSRDSQSAGSLIRLLWMRARIGWILTPVQNDGGRRRIRWSQILLMMMFCTSAAMLGACLFSWLVLGDLSYLWFGLAMGLVFSVYIVFKMIRVPIESLPKVSSS